MSSPSWTRFEPWWPVHHRQFERCSNRFNGLRVRENFAGFLRTPPVPTARLASPRESLSHRTLKSQVRFRLRLAHYEDAVAGWPKLIPGAASPATPSASYYKTRMKATRSDFSAGVS